MFWMRNKKNYFSVTHNLSPVARFIFQAVRKNIKKEELKPTTQALEKVQALCAENKNASELIVDVSTLFQCIK